jgi:hypothetical protein
MITLHEVHEQAEQPGESRSAPDVIMLDSWFCLYQMRSLRRAMPGREYHFEGWKGDLQR